MKKLSQYYFKGNGRAIVTYYLTQSVIKKRKIPGNSVDCLCLSLEEKDGASTRIFMRPDEALIIAEQLSSAVRKITQTYTIRYTKESGIK